MIFQRSISMARKTKVLTRENGDRVIAGYAAVFYDPKVAGTEYRIWSDMVERIMPTAFDDAIAEDDDVRGRFNHSRLHPLGLRSAGTLRIGPVDSFGLPYEIDVPDTTLGRDLVVSIERGDLPGSSFQFATFSGMARRGRVVWATEVIDGESVEIREVHNLELLDVSPVTDPAYTATTVEARSVPQEIELLRREREEYRKSQAPQVDGVELRARCVQIEMEALACRDAG